MCFQTVAKYISHICKERLLLLRLSAMQNLFRLFWFLPDASTLTAVWLRAHICNLRMQKRCAITDIIFEVLPLVAWYLELLLRELSVFDWDPEPISLCFAPLHTAQYLPIWYKGNRRRSPFVFVSRAPDIGVARRLALLLWRQNNSQLTCPLN